MPVDAGVTESTVNIFLRWLYHQRIQFEDGKYPLDDANLNQALELYRFADRYDTLLLRRACIDLLFGYICIHRDRQGTLRSRARLWSPEFMDKLHDSLPESSPLSRMIADDEVSHLEFESTEEAADWVEKTPAKLARRKLFLISRGKGRGAISLCDYHEHEFLHDGDICTGTWARVGPEFSHPGKFGHMVVQK